MTIDRTIKNRIVAVTSVDIGAKTIRSENITIDLPSYTTLDEVNHKILCLNVFGLKLTNL